MARNRSRGEKSFLRFPKPAVLLYDYMMRSTPAQLQYREIAEDIVSRVPSGRILDIGTGPGWLIKHINRLNSDLALFGLDISAEMIDRAQKNLSGINVDLRVGSIYSTDYPGQYFDCVACSGSFYVWDDPVAGLNGIYRILKGGCSAYLYESRHEINTETILPKIHQNLRNDPWIIRLIAPRLLLKQIRMTYSTKQYHGILRESLFADSYSIENIELAGIPIWVRIEVNKNS